MSMHKRYRFSEKKVSTIKAKTSGLCFYCGCELLEKEEKDEGGKTVVNIRDWDIDHVKPLSKGGGNDIENLVPSCKSCNSAKSNKYEEE